MGKGLIIRTVKTASGAQAVQIIRYANGRRIIVRHIGSATSKEDLAVLNNKAESERNQLQGQLSLFSEEEPIVKVKDLQLFAVTHYFAYDTFKHCIERCNLDFLPPLYQDLAIMRIIEPASKLRTIKLLKNYFNVSYTERTMYRMLPKLIKFKDKIEEAAYQTACSCLNESYALILYDVTTLYFESHEPDDELRARGFSKDDKSKQPQIVIGLLVTSQGFPIMHDVYKGNTFEGHTMLGIVKKFQKRHINTKPIIVADAAMLSQENLASLESEGYDYIVGARLANVCSSFIESIINVLPRTTNSIARLPYPERGYDIICTYSDKRERKDRLQFEKQINRAKTLIANQESGKRAKFVKKSQDGENPLFIFDEKLRTKTEKLLGIKGYCTNIPGNVIPDDKIVEYYYDLWRVEQSFRMAKTDLKARPIFHYTHDAIKAHVLVCFMALTMGKFLEIKSGLSLQRIRDILWDIHEAHIEDKSAGKKITLRTNLDKYYDSGLHEILTKPH